MKRTLRNSRLNLVWAAAGIIAFAASGCFLQSKEASIPGGTRQAQDGPEWKISLKSDCQGQFEEGYCVAEHGFSVLADGRYEVGPGPSGQVQGGHLSDEELALVSAQVGEIIGADFAAEAGESCAAADPTLADGLIDTVTLAHHGKEKAIYSEKGDQDCFQTAKLEVTRTLHDTIRALAVKYYAVPFPDSCTEAVDALQALYPAVQGCQSDADCAYVDPSYGAITAGASEFVVTDNCTLAKPLVVANAGTLGVEASKLQAALQTAQTACGARIQVSGCLNITGFQSDAGAPVCQQGACKVSPSIGQGQ